MTDVPPRNDANADGNSGVAPSPPSVTASTPAETSCPASSVHEEHVSATAQEPSTQRPEPPPVTVRLILPDSGSSQCEMVADIHETLVPGVEVEARTDNEQM